MKKQVFSLFLFSTVFLISTLPVLAVLTKPTLPTPPPLPENKSESRVPPQIPERNGDYPDPDFPGVRVRVFVHENKSPVLATSTQCIDPDSTAQVHAAGWKLPNGNWTYNLNLSSVPGSVGPNQLPVIAKNGFDAWQTAQSKVSFERGVNTNRTRSGNDKQNIVAWNRITANALGITYIRYYTASGLVVDVDTILNKRYQWSWSGNVSGGSCGDPNSYDVQAILTHEQGHWLGADDEYTGDYINNTMYGYGYKNDIKADTLTNGDKAGIAAIYP